jgi:hypothetical protein
MRTKAISSDDASDAFDAAVSALETEKHLSSLLALEPTQNPEEKLEGLIWYPGCK